MSGFTERSAEHQRAYEQRFQDGVSAESIGRTSRALSRRPQAETTGAAQVELDSLLEAAGGWREASEALEDRASELLAAGDTESSRASRAIRRINDALMRQERALIASDGLPGRPWFRHQVYAPGLVTGYAVQYLPGMRDAVEQGDEDIARQYRDLLLDSLRAASRLAQRASNG